MGLNLQGWRGAAPVRSAPHSLRRLRRRTCRSFRKKSVPNSPPLARQTSGRRGGGGAGAEAESDADKIADFLLPQLSSVLSFVFWIIERRIVRRGFLQNFTGECECLWIYSTPKRGFNTRDILVF